MILSEGSFPLSELHRIFFLFVIDELFIRIAIRNLVVVFFLFWNFFNLIYFDYFSLDYLVFRIFFFYF